MNEKPFNRQPNPAYTPPASTISMENRRQYNYNPQGIVGQWEGYPCQVVSLEPDDVLLVHISDDLDIDECENILKVLQKAFPNNQVLLSNEHIIKGMTIIKGVKKVDDKVDIWTGVDYKDIMGEYKNDFLY